MERLGTRLRSERTRVGLTLRETSERTLKLAQEWESPDYRISASWLDWIEREDRSLTATKLIVLAFIYGLTGHQIIALCPGTGGHGLERVSAKKDRALGVSNASEIVNSTSQHGRR